LSADFLSPVKGGNAIPGFGVVDPHRKNAQRVGHIPAEYWDKSVQKGAFGRN
jgi:hypothetical protein